MSFILQAQKTNSALQIQSWFEASKNAMVNAKSSYDSIKTQLESMKTNVDYTTEDITEVENILLELNSIASSMI